MSGGVRGGGSLLPGHSPSTRQALSKHSPSTRQALVKHPSSLTPPPSSCWSPWTPFWTSGLASGAKNLRLTFPRAFCIDFSHIFARFEVVKSYIFLQKSVSTANTLIFSKFSSRVHGNTIFEVLGDTTSCKKSTKCVSKNQRKKHYVWGTIFRGFRLPFGSLGTLLGASRGLLGTSWGPLGSLLGRLGALLGTSWQPLGDLLDPLRSLLAPPGGPARKQGSTNSGNYNRFTHLRYSRIRA